MYVLLIFFRLRFSHVSCAISPIYIHTARSQQSCVLFVACYCRSRRRRRLRRHTYTSDVVSCVCVCLDRCVCVLFTPNFNFKFGQTDKKIKTSNKNVENKLTTVLFLLPAECWENTLHTHQRARTKSCPFFLRILNRK